MSAPFRVALTGGIGSGKSTIASLFSSLDVPVIDSDVISRNVVKPGGTILNELAEEFGQEIIMEKGGLDRNKLRLLIFNDNSARKKLEELLHPVIYEEINKKIATTNHPYCLVVIPLLIETNAMSDFDRVLLIDVPETIQIERTSSRDDLPPEFIRKIIKTQANRVDRLKKVDDIIENTVNVNELKHMVEKLHQYYLELATNDAN